ncbi:MAG: hypothetical protein HOQ05_12040 [Corynebacteriales bacterium]|nr:hypothetical protein [Mycobacteriales bacterium]
MTTPAPSYGFGFPDGYQQAHLDHQLRDSHRDLQQATKERQALTAQIEAGLRNPFPSHESQDVAIERDGKLWDLAKSLQRQNEQLEAALFHADKAQQQKGAAGDIFFFDSTHPTQDQLRDGTTALEIEPDYVLARIANPSAPEPKVIGIELVSTAKMPQGQTARFDEGMTQEIHRSISRGELNLASGAPMPNVITVVTNVAEEHEQLRALGNVVNRARRMFPDAQIAVYRSPSKAVGDDHAASINPADFVRALGRSTDDERVTTNLNFPTSEPTRPSELVQWAERAERLANAEALRARAAHGAQGGYANLDFEPRRGPLRSAFSGLSARITGKSRRRR